MPKPLISGFYIPAMAFVWGEMLIFAVDMKRFAIFSLYWGVSLLLLAAILWSMGYRLPEALMLSTSLLPVAIVFRQMIARVSFASNRREAIKSTILILLFVLTLAFLAVHVAQSVILFDYRQVSTISFDVPPLLLNPVFLLSVLTLMMIGDYGLGRMLGKSLPEEEETITFVSNRQSVTLARQEILYVESCDTEVWIHATEGRRFRNKTSITSWSNLLGSEYLRIHRSYLVRLSACTGLEHDNVIIGEAHLPVSRKYKEEVQERLRKTAEQGRNDV
ncbi:MAG: LytTR family transcriptional regulator [Bacteroidaceae bacterium]|nr:LytTR family transcriptional regulator [Bacteroidaceae bacterium]